MKAERIARLFVTGLAAGVPLAVLVAHVAGIGAPTGQTIELHARVPEAGGWSESAVTLAAGAPIHLRLTSDDVLHGFAMAQSDRPAVDVKPGEMTELTLTFDQPGRYTFYCTRWCSPNHWRMRGTIEVTGPATVHATVEPPLYQRLGLDIDAPHPASVTPEGRPSAARGSRLGRSLPAPFLAQDYYRSHSPAAVWQALRAATVSMGLSDSQVWDLVALVWQTNTTPQALAAGRALFAANCTACHGETGRGDGVAAPATTMPGESMRSPADFADASTMLGASPAVLQGKIVRGGMGTGMPYWGPIFTDSQTWALVSYVWTFQFNTEEKR